MMRSSRYSAFETWQPVSERRRQRSRNRRLGWILIGAFAALFIGSVVYIILYRKLVGG
jgi:hypothetical protein